MKKSLQLIPGIILLLISNNVSSQIRIDPSDGFTLENKFARYVFEPVGLGLSSMIDLQTGFNHIDTVEGHHTLMGSDLWQRDPATCH